jgi:hypothetical protein
MRVRLALPSGPGPAGPAGPAGPTAPSGSNIRQWSQQKKNLKYFSKSVAYSKFIRTFALLFSLNLF